MNNLYFSNTTLPVVCAADRRCAAESFTHADRVLDFNVLIYVLSGTIYVTEGDTDYAADEGTLLFLEHGRRHFGKTECPAGTSWIFAHFYLDTPPLPDFAPDTTDIGVHEKLESRVPLPKALHSLQGSELESALIHFAELAASGRDNKRFMLNLALADILAQAAFFTRTEPALSDRIAAYLDENINRPFSSKELEKKFFLSYKRLAAVFKKEKGVSMQAYHNERRLAAAAAKLRTTALPVGDIAEQSGFNDSLYFSRCFKAHFSLSPREYREKMSRKY